MDDSLVQRVSLLERQNRRLKIWATALSCLFGLAVLAGAQTNQFNTVTTKMLRIVDDANKPRIALGVDDANHAVLLFFAQDGQTPRMTTVVQDSVEQVVLDSKGVKRFDINDSGTIRLFDSKGSPRMRMGTAEQEAGKAYVAFFDEKGAVKRAIGEPKE